MTIIFDTGVALEPGLVELKLERRFRLKITAEEARRQVNRWLLNEVSYMMRALSPTLVIGEKVVWRVPVALTMPHVGQAGTVGVIEVEVETGAMNNTPGRQAEIERCAAALAAKVRPYEPRRETPAKYITAGPKLTMATASSE
jgi:hypothetical protein